MVFGEEYLLLCVCGKIFVYIGLERPDFFVVKCAHYDATKIREHNKEITPAWHWNKKYWNQLSLCGSLSDALILSLIRHSYHEVVKKLPKATRNSFPEMLDITD